MLNWVPTKAQRPHRLNRLPGVGRRLCVAREHGGTVGEDEWRYVSLEYYHNKHDNILLWHLDTAHMKQHTLYGSPCKGARGWKKKLCALHPEEQIAGSGGGAARDSPMPGPPHREAGQPDRFFTIPPQPITPHD